MNFTPIAHAMFAEALYALLGILIFGLAFWLMQD